MADSEKSVSYTVDANADGFVAAMQKAEAASKSAAKSIENSFNQLAAPLKAVQGYLGLIVGLMAGGAGFGAVINTTKDWGNETIKLSKQLQITSTEATAYQVAAHRLGIESTTLIEASDKMTKQLSKNELAFKTIGVETRNANGSFRSTGELLPEVMDKLRGIHNTTEQNVAGMKLFGKGWVEVRALLKVGAEELDHARQRVKELNLEVSGDDLKRYKASLNDTKLVVTALSVNIGKALMPALSDLGAAFAELAGPIVWVVKVVHTAFTAIFALLKTLAAAVNSIWLSIGLVMQGRFSEAVEMQKRGGQAMAAALKEGWEKGLGIWTPKPPTSKVPTKDEDHTDFDKAKNAKENILALWEAQLEERKLKLAETAAVEGRFTQMGKDEELAYWRDKLSLTQAGSTDQITVRKKIAALSLDILKDSFPTELAALQTQEGAYKNNLEARRTLIEQEAALVAQKYGQHSKEYEAVQAKLVALAREYAAQRVQVEEITQGRLRTIALAQEAVEEADLQLRLDLQKITHGQYLQAEQQLEDRRYEIKRAALDQRLALEVLDKDNNPVAVAKTNAELEALELAHQQRLTEIRNKAAIDMAQPMLTLQKNMEGAFTQLGQSMLTNWRNIGAALRTTMASIGQMIVSELFIKPLAAKASAVAADMVMKATQVEGNAVVAGSGAAASQASIPYIGPVLALAAMAAMMASVRGLKTSIPSAAGGWDIPRDSLAMVHAREMILPAKHADVIRNLADGNGAARDPEVHVHMHNNIQALDGQSVRRVLVDNSSAVAAAVQVAIRNFSLRLT